MNPDTYPEDDFNETACNNTGNETYLEYCGDEEIQYLCDEFDFGTINAVFFFAVFVLSITGNTLLLCVLIRYENLKKVTNLFVLNLACSDLVFTLTLPFWAVYYQLSYWVFGDFACKFLFGAYFVGLYSSIILLTAMTVDRFATMVVQKWPSNPAKRQRCAVGACAFAWAVSVAASLNDAIRSKVEDRGGGFYTCEASSTGPDGAGVTVGDCLQVSLLFLLPFAIIVFCYSAILRTVVLRAATKSKHRAVVVVLTIVVTFFVCWAPYNMLLFFMSLYKPHNCYATQRLFLTFDISRLLAYSHCCMNPMLYMLSQKFRKHLLRLFACGNAHNKEREREKSNQSTSNVFRTAAVKVRAVVATELQSIDLN
ncbi:chemokine XC receptor 1-like [Polymixia lowei]